MAQAESSLNVVGLLSGGKDSCYNLCQCVKLGHRIVALATLSPPDGKDELDSYMYQTVGHDAVHLIAEAMGLPLYRTTIRGKAINQGASYGDRLPSQTGSALAVKEDDEHHDETEDLYELLLKVKQAHPEVNAVSVGAILSNYQRVRVEHVALRSDVQMLPLSFLWQRDQAELLEEMCAAGMKSVLIKVAGAGLERSDLGKSLAQMRTKLHRLNKLYGAHICGEGGEYETFTLDCPLFKRRIVLDKHDTVVHGLESSDGVYYMTVSEAHLEAKDEQWKQGQLDDVRIPPLFDKQSCTARDRASAAVYVGKISSASITEDDIPLIAISYHSPAFAAFSHSKSTIGETTNGIADLFAALQRDLASKGLSLANLSHLNVYLGSQQDFAALNHLYRKLFGVDPPSRACIAAGSGATVALDAIAQTSIRSQRKALHVQGRSHWAAANIGPYSQAVESQGYISIAGQIGLAPQTLDLVEASEDQIVLALQHARRIQKAILEEHRVTKRQGWVESCICWVNEAEWVAIAQRTWSVQSPSLLDDEENGDECWDQEWLGAGLLPNQIPTVFAQLAADGLPRGAVVEWQLTAQSGDLYGNDHAAEEEDVDLTPVSAHGRAHFLDYDCRWQTLSSGTPAWSCFGVACLTKNSDQSIDKENTSFASRFTQVLSSALLIRVLYKSPSDTAAIRQLLAELRAPAVTWIEVDACYDSNAKQVDAAIIWQSRK